MRGQIPQLVSLWWVTKMDNVEVTDKEDTLSVTCVCLSDISLSLCALNSRQLHIVPLRISTVFECSPINLHDSSRK